MSAEARQIVSLLFLRRCATFAIVVVFPAPFIPANNITKGFSFFSFICSIRLGGLIKRSSIDSFRACSISIFEDSPTSFFSSDFFIFSTAT